MAGGAVEMRTDALPCVGSRRETQVEEVRHAACDVDLGGQKRAPVLSMPIDAQIERHPPVPRYGLASHCLHAFPFVVRIIQTSCDGCMLDRAWRGRDS